MGTVGDDEATLLALCWMMRNPIDSGISREEVVDALQARGVPRPASPVPSDYSLGERINVAPHLLDSVIEALQEIDALLGFNTDSENSHAWVRIAKGDERARALVERLAR